MSATSSLRAFGSILTLRELRGALRSWRRRAMVVGIAAIVTFASMLISGMLTFFPTQGAYTAEVIWWGAPSSWWFYPEILVVQPWGLLQLPFLATLAMGLVALAAGMGATVALGSVRRILDKSHAGDRRSGAAGIAAGLGPGIASLATLGACCCTSCASVGGLALVAVASGTTVASLLRSEWYLPIFQLGVVFTLLIAQERAMRAALSECIDPPPVDRRFFAGALLRVGLLVAGITWSMAMFVEWGTTSPVTASAAIWYHWTFEHQLLSLTAIAAAIFPNDLSNMMRRAAGSPFSGIVRVALAVAAVSWGFWVPPTLVSWGLGGFGNELFGFLGLPGAWGAVTPDAPVGAPLLFHWTFQHLLLSLFGLSLAISPQAALGPLLASTGRSRSPTIAGSEAPRREDIPSPVVTTQAAGLIEPSTGVEPLE